MCESIIAGTTKLATDKSDTHLFDFLETHFKQMKSILKTNDYIINLCKTGVQESGISVCTFDKHTWETVTISMKPQAGFLRLMGMTFHGE